MISIDDHSPPDPSSSDYQNHHQQQEQQDSHHLKINSDEKATASVSDIDLLKSLDANLDDSNNPLPNFSIRDYVFSSRSKDIACNWPFSRENMQLCLHYGVKNLLPPFQSLYVLRSYSSVSGCTVENHLPNAEIVSSFDGTPIDDRFVSIASFGIQSNQELDSETRKTEDATIQTATKKCKVLVKLNSSVEPVKEVTANSLIVSENMGSKVCPVCKTFSSSSNTTLNAHIDRCLSGESNMKWTANPKIMVTHRMKPRKTRLMVDIYETAPHCTVEELDKRNGTSWAADSNFPDQEFEFQGEEKEEPREPAFTPDVADHEGAVYIDTSGTKVRILLQPKVSALDDCEVGKFQKRGNGRKTIMGKKKNNAYGHKHCRKFLKLSPNNKKFCSPKPHGAFEARSGREGNVTVEGSWKKEDRDQKPMKAQVRMQMDDSTITRPPWACSKRTGLAKKLCSKDGILHSRHGATKGLLVESDKSSSGSRYKTIPSASDDMSSSQRSKEVGSSSPYRKQHLTTNTVVKFSSDSPVGNYAKKRFLVLAKPKEGSKFSSLKKNLLQTRRERIPGSKFNLKRKFSAIKKSRVRCLPVQNAVVGPSQDSSEQALRTEEGTSEKLSFEKVNIVKVNKKKSVTSKSSNEDSSGGLGTASEDLLIDVESARTKLRSHGEQVGIVPAPVETDVEASFMGLRNSLNDAFLKLVGQPDIKFDSLYQDRLCSPKGTLDDLENIMIGHDVEDHMDGTEKQVNYFHEVDPIPIPGPPGSFLPSPGGDMVSEELQGNSSVTTTSRVQSSIDWHHHDMMERDYMSDSPISTISNPTRSDSRFSDKLPVRFTSLQDARLGYAGVMVDAVDEKSVPITSSANASDCTSIDVILAGKGPTPNGSQNDQPCCCSTKEGASSHTGASNYQESAFLRKRAPESNRSVSEMSSLINNPILPPPPPQTVVFAPTMKLPADAAIKLPVHRGCYAAVSPSKPILRLMGKNLTVVKTDDDASSSQQFRPPPSLSPMGHQKLHNIQKEDCNSFFRGYPSQHPIIFGHNQNGSKRQHFNVHQPNNSRSLVDMRPVHALGTMPASKTSGLMAPAECYRLDTHVARESNIYNTPSKPTKEIIVIADSSENEADDGMLNEYTRTNHASFSSPPMHHQSQGSAHPYGGGVSPFRPCLSRKK